MIKDTITSTSKSLASPNKSVFDYVLIAENFISYTIGIHLLNAGHRVVIIDNPNINLPENLIRRINLLDLSLIKKIAPFL